MTWTPPPGFLEALTTLDTEGADVIVTPDADAAEWARANGYRVETSQVDSEPIFEIFSGDRGPAAG
jgi:hypothetical protein